VEKVGRPRERNLPQAAKMLAVTANNLKDCGNLFFGTAASFPVRRTPALCYTCLTSTTREARGVDLTLRLDVLAVFASFLLVGAILLGAF
jgi:hypothetical protein